MAHTRVLIIDDSALIREVLTQILQDDPDITVVGTARDPIAALPKIAALRPDVLTLDVEMPRQDGLSFLEELMRDNPMPVVMVSGLTQRGCETTLRALELGAFDFVEKPKLDVATGTFALAGELVAKVKAAAASQRRARVAPPPPATRGDDANRVRMQPTIARLRVAAVALENTQVVIALGASTGGTEALREVLCELPPDCPPVVVVQHMPPMFTKAFAARLNTLCQLSIKEAVDGDRAVRGTVLIAPGDFHMTLARSGSGYVVRLDQEPRLHNCRPAVDRLFDSVASVVGRNAVAGIMTGMGGDGAKGLLAIRQAGGQTLAQNEATCVVFGMPAVAIRLGAAERVVPLRDIATALMGFVRAR